MKIGVIYLRDIIEEAKKNFVEALLSCKNWKDYHYCDLFYDTLSILKKRLQEMEKEYEKIVIWYGKSYTEYNRNDTALDCLIGFWDKIKRIEDRLKLKYLRKLEQKLGRYKHPWM